MAQSSEALLNQNHCRLSLQVFQDIKQQKNLNLPVPVQVTAKEQPQKTTVYWRPFEGGASFADPICYLCFKVVCTCIYHAVLSFLAPCCRLLGWDGLLFVGFSCVLLLFHVVSQVQCGTWLYKFPDLYLFLYFE